MAKFPNLEKIKDMIAEGGTTDDLPANVEVFRLMVRALKELMDEISFQIKERDILVDGYDILADHLIANNDHKGTGIIGKTLSKLKAGKEAIEILENDQKYKN